MGNLLLDVGAGGARASLCSLGGVVLFRSTTAGGDALSAAIRDWLARERGIEVSRSTAETLKEHVVDVSGASIRQTRIRGTAPSGQPIEQVIGSQELDAVLQPLVSRICGAVTDVLTDATPELSADILDRGLVLTGEAARLRGLSDLLGNHTQLPVVLAEPLGHAQITGAAMLLSDPQRLEGWTSP